MRIKIGSVIALIALMLAAAGCARTADVNHARPEATKEPQLDQAATQLEQLLRGTYAKWYSGLRLDSRTGTMTIYRKPGSDLDRVVRSKAMNFRIVFSNSRLSEKEMLSLAERVMADTGYWRGQGIQVVGAGPLPDGSAIKVLTADGSAGEAARLSTRYGQRIVVERGSVAGGPYVGPLPTPPRTAPTGK